MGWQIRRRRGLILCLQELRRSVQTVRKRVVRAFTRGVGTTCRLTRGPKFRRSVCPEKVTQKSDPMEEFGLICEDW